jgi:hypothetical protein
VRIVFVHLTHFISETEYTIEPAYTDIGLYETSTKESDILWYELIPH